MSREIPDYITAVGFDFRWKVEDVWELDVQVEKIRTDELVWHFEIPFWSKPGGYYDLSVNEVLSQPELFSGEYKKIISADTSYPIDIMEQHGRWVILDGLHRLAKIVDSGGTEIAVRKVPRSMIPFIAR